METLTKNNLGQWNLEKAKQDRGHSVFMMDHVNEVAKMKDHSAAKKYVHSIVDASTANASNKAKIKSRIDASKSIPHLVTTMSNHILAHPAEGLKVL